MVGAADGCGTRGLAVIGLVTTAYFNRQPLPAGTNYLEGWFANNASTSAALDLIVVFVAASIFMVADARRSRIRWPWLYVVFAIPLAIAFTFPLYLAIRTARAPRPTSPSPADAAVTTPVLPATTLFVAPEPGVTLGSIVPTDVTEPCPSSTSASPDGSEAMMAEVTRLEPMIGQVLAYGQAHADVFGSYGLVWLGGDDASVFASFTGDLDIHRTALAATVPYPDELVVCQIAVIGPDAATLQAQLARELEGRYWSLGIGATGLQVGLDADEDAMARELVDRYGGAVEVSVGAMRYPPELAVDTCIDLPAPVSIPGLSIVAATTIVTAESMGATTIDGNTAAPPPSVTLTNTRSAPIRFNSGITSGLLIDEAGDVVSANLGGIAALGIGVDLAPGASTDLPLVVGTASCRAALGYTLPPGSYRLVVLVPANGSTVVSEPVDITLG